MGRLAFEPDAQQTFKSIVARNREWGKSGVNGAFEVELGSKINPAIGKPDSN